MERDARRDELLGNVEAVRARIARSARDPKCPPVLLPVTKTHPAEDILLLKEAGIDAIGENRVQEITAKYPALQGHFSIHLIGQLQTNKIKYIIIDRVCTADALAAGTDSIGSR